MPKQIINPSTLSPPAGYSYAVKKHGTPVFIAGQVGIGADGRIAGEGDVAAQTEQAFQNVRTVVEACGGTMDDIVKITIYVTDPAFRPPWSPHGSATSQRTRRPPRPIWSSPRSPCRSCSSRSKRWR
jgi:enamine deaminase RidA (YjgF/YER057c/UK114 family)